MNNYRYSVRDRYGRVSNGELLAPDQDEAIRLLQGTDVYVISVQPFPGFSFPFQFGRLSVPDEQKIFLLESWSMFLEIGMSVQSALLRLQMTIRHPGVLRALRSIQSSIDRGTKLSEAVAASRLFPPSWVAVLSQGEGVGNFVRPLREMRRQILQLRRLKGEALRMLTMPGVLLAMTLAWFWVFLHSVVPALMGFGSAIGFAHPMVTVLADKTPALSYAMLVLALLMALAVLFAMRMSRSNQVMGTFQTWIPTRTPVLGPIVSSLHLLVVASELRLLLEAGIPLEAAIHALSLSTPHRQVRRELFEVYGKIREGVPADEALFSLSFIPPDQRVLLTAGNSSGRLPKALEVMVRLAQEQVRFGLRNLATCLQAGIVFACGMLVGLVVLAYFGLWFSSVSAAAGAFSGSSVPAL